MFDLFNEGNKLSEIRKKSNLACFRGFFWVPIKCETKRNEIKKNETKSKKWKRNQRKQNEIDWYEENGRKKIKDKTK